MLDTILFDPINSFLFYFIVVVFLLYIMFCGSSCFFFFFVLTAFVIDFTCSSNQYYSHLEINVLLLNKFDVFLFLL